MADTDTWNTAIQAALSLQLRRVGAAPRAQAPIPTEGELT
jgi:hypothetical protein